MVSLRFGEMPESGPFVLIRSGLEYVKPPEFDIDEYIAEVLYGVSEANRIHDSDLQVEEIEISSVDFPARGQVGHCAEKLVGYALNDQAEQVVAGNPLDV
ncbi:hypothetical protein NT6N_27690 [Oceaniferula spumae]|uniref:Uncharacterized protein n=1 Tax=Oceaniferula spumae TaxID=2979115 RepID=A0AAT9FPA2_9BACT